MSENPPPFVIENREQLLGLLAEAAEIEHNLMCCYLYAAFSLKQSTSEGVTEAELATIGRWRGQILHVAVDEMGHLALVANLMAAVGGAPHFGRANFPIAAGYHPAGIVVKLAPFNRATLDHFIYLERPEGNDIADGAGFEPPRRYQRGATPGRLMPSSHDYDTVGQLYHAIRDGLDRLVRTHGEEAVFVGPPERQLGPELASLPGITRVRCAKTARAALDGIVIQGEGAPGHAEGSHYQRFLEIRREYEALAAARPAFTPARPAAHNPVMRTASGSSCDRPPTCSISSTPRTTRCYGCCCRPTRRRAAPACSAPWSRRPST
jgi:Ferritin-like